MSVMPARSSTPCWRRVSIALRMFCSETPADRKSTRLNSSHLGTSYDVFCLKKKTNLHLLFWLSLVPFVTAWMGDTRVAAWPVARYGTVLLGSAIAYFILAHSLVAIHGSEPP